ncbi:class I SAM-dependent methyltransferase [Sporomusa sp. KB1]|jgi:SAM-dependent methyltransferase|uniref:class I SAM-dependent methyltransferase n=1 Tax=Sporomusa sp. KB1 TaxID=943346 RepID=UPI0011A5AEED|nr:class I SAM-dependent methyltransferase [Sporomusa sp. KB1]TWH46114.1 pyochelin synthetase [Sporomusa sp. KB1]
MKQEDFHTVVCDSAFGRFCSKAADSDLGGISAADITLFVRQLEQAVFSSMIHTFQTQGVLTNREREYSLTKILSVFNTAPQHQCLIRRWLRLLTERDWLKFRGDNYYGAAAVSKVMLDQCWSAARKSWDGRLGSPLAMDYLISNVRRLPQLMSGEQQAALLLFPEGKMDYANALYRESITARYLNQATAEAVSRIVAAKKLTGAESEEQLHIVEIGAGTGATTAVVVPRLKAAVGALSIEYLFTDISNFFLLAARENFKDYPWMRFQIVDIDKNFVQQGLKAKCADIIIAAGILNNAADTDKTVEGLMHILAEGGWMLITEPTGEFPEMLISQAFMMSRPEDDRKNTKTTFMSVDQWLDVFRKAGAAEVLTLPDEAHPLTPLGQKFFAVRKK